MNRERHCVTDPHHSSECVRAPAQVCDLAKELERMFLWLKRELLSVAVAQYLDVRCFNFNSLSFGRRGNELAFNRDTCACCYTFQQSFIERIQCSNGLYILDGRSIVDGNKLIVAKGPYPATDQYFLTSWCCAQQFFDFRPFHLLKRWLQKKSFYAVYQSLLGN